jgi:acetyl esterase/lipase
MLGLAAACCMANLHAQPTAEPAVSEHVVLDDRYPERHVNFAGGVVGTPDLVYASLPGFRPLHLDLYQPPREATAVAHPLVIYIHGGGWMGGQTRQSGAFSNWPSVLASLAARGYVVASVEYRLSGEARFPAAEQDIKSAIRWLRAHAANYGIDKAHGLVWGASAGGQLAALTATTCGVAELEPSSAAAAPGEPPRASPGSPDAGAGPPESDCVQAAITWYGVFDFSTLGGQRAAHSTAAPAGGDSADARYLGCKTAECSPAVIAAASPVTYVRHDSPPMLLVHGQMDKTVPVQQSQEFYDKLRAAGVTAQLLLIPDVDHSFIGKTPEATRAASRQALAKVFQFIDETLKGGHSATRAAGHKSSKGDADENR